MKLLVSISVFLIVFIAFVRCDEELIENDIDVEELKNPCENHKCSSGQECILDFETDQPICVCIRECPKNIDVRRLVCSNYNTTWDSDCHLLKRRCDCVEGNIKGCIEDDKHLHIDYYGECKEIEPCRPEVLEDFPRRMREWLDNIISQHIESKAQNKDHMTHKWIDAIIWKFCDLDREPHDRQVSRHELFPLRAPLLSMESCIGTFLDDCDADGDHKITLEEWGNCLGANKDEMEDKCNQYVSLKKQSTEISD